MKLLFLDFDGVLNTRCSFAREDYFDSPLESEFVKRLNRIVASSKADVVISSSWRIFDKHKPILYKAGFEGRVIGSTPSISDSLYPDKMRAGEILSYIEMNSLNPSNIVAIDDDMDVSSLGKYFVRTNLDVGMTECDADMAIKILNEIPWSRPKI